jgi:hypothetical protein
MTSISRAEKAALDRAIQLVRERRTESSDIAYWAKYVRDDSGIVPRPVSIVVVLRSALDLPLAPEGHWIMSWVNGEIDDDALREKIPLQSWTQ